MIKKFIFILAIVLLAPSFTEAATITRPSNGLGLVGYWTFDGPQMTTNVADVSGRGNNLYLTNFTSTTTSAGRVGQALSFNATNKHVQGSAVSSVYNISQRTFAFWVKLNDAGATNHFFVNLETDLSGGVSPSGYLWWTGKNQYGLGTNKFVTGWCSAGCTDITFDWTPIANRWYHISMTYNGTTVTMYVDGVSIGTNETGTSPPSANAAPVLGLQLARGATPYTLDGILDEVRFYNRALSANEVKALYNAGSARVNVTQANKLTNGLVGHWTFDGNKMTSNVADSSGYGNNGYLQGQTSTTTAIGKIGQALRFDGVDDYVAVSDHTSLDIAGTMTVTMWVKIESMELTGGASYTLGLIDKKIGDYGDADGFLIWAWSSGGERFWLTGSGNGEAISSVVDVDDKQWHFMAFTVDGTTGRIYRDMVDITADSVMPAIVANNDQLTLGYKQTVDTANIGGIMDDVRIYNRVLSLSELNQLYNMGR